MTLHFVKTDTILDKILTHKVTEVTDAKKLRPASRVRQTAENTQPPRDALTALNKETVTLIAEVKHASPSKGVLIENFDPIGIGQAYDQHGASAISVLTDEKFFQGHLDSLSAISEAVSVPVLRKDFVIDPYQIFEARAAKADMILLIVAVLSDAQLKDFYELTISLGMMALVEVHDETELERALALDVNLIGVNNRDLRTFEVSLETTERLATYIPSGKMLVAESGISSVDDVRRMGRLGASAVLVGESLVKSSNMVETIRAFSRQPKEGSL